MDQPEKRSVFTELIEVDEGDHYIKSNPVISAKTLQGLILLYLNEADAWNSAHLPCRPVLS